MSFSHLQVVIFTAVTKMFSPDTTPIFEFNDSFISPSVFYIKFLYNFWLHAAIPFPLVEKAKELADH